jgi:L-ascorbate metabolism protein UlaG (beta-lactamase superfamily)
VRCTHGLGLVGALMAHGVGYLIALPDEPTLYLSGDTVLTETVRRFVVQHQPDVCVVPAGGAHFDLGGDIIMGVDDVIAFARIATGRVLANHMEALGHCPVRRDDVRRATEKAGMASRVWVPEDGTTIDVK